MRQPANPIGNHIEPTFVVEEERVLVRFTNKSYVGMTERYDIHLIKLKMGKGLLKRFKANQSGAVVKSQRKIATSKK